MERERIYVIGRAALSLWTLLARGGPVLLAAWTPNGRLVCAFGAHCPSFRGPVALGPRY